MISSWFVKDLVIDNWPNKRANHTIHCIGGSSLSKAQAFAKEYVPASNNANVKTYGSYQEVYDDPDVECVYIGTPHSFHKQNCLDAIKAGKNVLCEKPFAMNEKQAKEVFDAAREKGVFVMEAMWTRFYPLIKSLQKVLHEEKRLGKLYRTFCDFGRDIDIENLPEGSRYVDPALGAGSLLDLGVYSLTIGILTLNDAIGDAAEDPEISSAQTLHPTNVDVNTTAILHYKSNGRQAICSSTTNSEVLDGWAKIEGSKGHIVLNGEAPSAPESFTFYPKDGKGETEVYEFEKPGRGFWWEADAVAVSIREGKQESETMPWAETLRLMR